METKHKMFTGFLLKNKTLDSFKENLLKKKKILIGDPYLIYIKRTTRKLLIINAFPWSRTDQGYRYWMDLHKKWIEEIEAYDE